MMGSDRVEMAWAYVKLYPFFPNENESLFSFCSPAENERDRRAESSFSLHEIKSKRE